MSGNHSGLCAIALQTSSRDTSSLHSMRNSSCTCPQISAPDRFFIKKIPGKVLTKINQKVGFRFITKFGTKGIVNLGKMLPGVGAVIGGGLDLVETKVIADRAYK